MFYAIPRTLLPYAYGSRPAAGGALGVKRVYVAQASVVPVIMRRLEQLEPPYYYFYYY